MQIDWIQFLITFLIITTIITTVISIRTIFILGSNQLSSIRIHHSQ